MMFSLRPPLRSVQHYRGQQRHLQSGLQIQNTPLFQSRFPHSCSSPHLPWLDNSLQKYCPSLYTSLSSFLPRTPGSSLWNRREVVPSAPGSPRRTRRVPGLQMAPQTALDNDNNRALARVVSPQGSCVCRTRREKQVFVSVSDNSVDTLQPPAANSCTE